MDKLVEAERKIYRRIQELMETDLEIRDEVIALMKSHNELQSLCYRLYNEIKKQNAGIAELKAEIEKLKGQ